MTTSMRADLAALAAALARELGQRFDRLVRAADRLDALEGRSGPITSDELASDRGALEATARELVSRALRAAADPRAGALLRAVARAARPLRELASELALPRLVVGRIVDDLADAGLAERDLGTDIVAATAAGAGVVELLDELERGTAEELARRVTGPPILPGGPAGRIGSGV